MEQPVTFNVGADTCLGIIHKPAESTVLGVLVVVGGPQYRVGSHRQFVQLSRALAKNRISSMRFDYRGMGDSQGKKQSFDDVCDDIAAATDCFMQHCPDLQGIVVWGLCDAASAAMIYSHKDARVKGLVLLNPWLRGAAATGKTMLKHYYISRLLSGAFWRKLLSGKVNIGGSLSEAKGFAKDSVSRETNEAQSYQQRMLQGMQQYHGATCLILSGNDLTAKEFIENTQSHSDWKKRLKNNVEVCRVAQADHTFSSREYKQQVEKLTIDFIRHLNG